MATTQTKTTLTRTQRAQRLATAATQLARGVRSGKVTLNTTGPVLDNDGNTNVVGTVIKKAGLLNAVRSRVGNTDNTELAVVAALFPKKTPTLSSTLLVNDVYQSLVVLNSSNPEALATALTNFATQLRSNKKTPFVAG